MANRLTIWWSERREDRIERFYYRTFSRIFSYDSSMYSSFAQAELNHEVSAEMARKKTIQKFNLNPTWQPK